MAPEPGSTKSTAMSSWFAAERKAGKYSPAGLPVSGAANVCPIPEPQLTISEAPGGSESACARTPSAASRVAAKARVKRFMMVSHSTREMIRPPLPLPGAGQDGYHRTRRVKTQSKSAESSLDSPCGNAATGLRNTTDAESGKPRASNNEVTQ